MTRKKITLVAAMLLLLPCMAFATAVTFNTNASVGVSGPGASFITYKPVNKHVPSTPASNVAFGMLKIKCKTSCDTLATTSLSVTITQTFPGHGSRTTHATLTGTITKTSGGAFVITWGGPVKIQAGGYQTAYNPITTAAVCSHGNCTIKLKVDITQVAALPEPNAQLLLGLGMLGLMGLATVSRKMISV